MSLHRGGETTSGNRVRNRLLKNPYNVIARSPAVAGRRGNLEFIDLFNCKIAEFIPSDTDRDCFAFGSQ